MKILFIAPIPFFYERGACVRTRNIVEAASELGHRVDILTYPEGEELSISNVNIIRVKSPFKPPLEAKMTLGRLFTDFLLYRKASSMIGETKYDCIICKNPIGRWIGRKLKEKTGTPLIIDVVEPALGMVSLYSKRKLFKGFLLASISRLALLNPITVNFLKNLEKANYEAADVILANWDLVAEDVKEKSGKETILLYDKIPSVLEKPANASDLKEKLGISDEKVLLYIGAFSPQQGIDIYLKAMKNIENAKLVLVGPATDEYKEMARDLGVADRVVFTGSVPMAESPLYYSIADVLLTAYDSGGLNATVKLLIYMFQKKPIIASDVPQYRQIVDSETVFLANPTPEDFGEKIKEALENQSEAERLADNAYKLAQEKFSHEIYMKKIDGILKKAGEKN